MRHYNAKTLGELALLEPGPRKIRIGDRVRATQTGWLGTVVGFVKQANGEIIYRITWDRSGRTGRHRRTHFEKE